MPRWGHLAGRVLFCPPFAVFLMTSASLSFLACFLADLAWGSKRLKTFYLKKKLSARKLKSLWLAQFFTLIPNIWSKILKSEIFDPVWNVKDGKRALFGALLRGSYGLKIQKNGISD